MSRNSGTVALDIQDANVKNCVYYLPGQGGRLATGLGENLAGRGLNIVGRETIGEFKDLPFQEKIELIARDLQDHFWHEDAQVIANSFGGYLFLHAQTLIESYIGRVLLLSPIVGEFENTETWMSFIPPRAGRLKELALEGKFPSPKVCEIHVGEKDWQSNPESVSSFASRVGIPVFVIPGAGHMLDKGYVGQVLDRWLLHADQ